MVCPKLNFEEILFFLAENEKMPNKAIKGIQLVGARSALPVASVFIGEVSAWLSVIESSD